MECLGQHSYTIIFPSFELLNIFQLSCFCLVCNLNKASRQILTLTYVIWFPVTSQLPKRDPNHLLWYPRDSCWHDDDTYESLVC